MQYGYEFKVTIFDTSLKSGIITRFSVAWDIFCNHLSSGICLPTVNIAQCIRTDILLFLFILV